MWPACHQISLVSLPPLCSTILAVCQNICNDSKIYSSSAPQRINSQDEFSFRYFRLSLSLSVPLCLHCSCFFDIFNCLFAQHMAARCWDLVAPANTHVSVAPDIPDQFSCSPPRSILLSLSLALLVCKSLCSRNGSSINMVYQAYPMLYTEYLSAS